MKTNHVFALLCALGLALVSTPDLRAGEKLSVAVFPFKSTVPGATDLGDKIADLCAEFLSDSDTVQLVERARIDDALKELELSLSALADKENALKVGKLVSAKLLVFGKVFALGDQVYVVARIVSTETTRLKAVKAKAPVDGDLAELVEDMTRKLLVGIEDDGPKLIARRSGDEKPPAERLKKALAGQPRMRVLVSVEERHRSRAIIDPAAETELLRELKTQGFTLVDESSADVAAWLSDFHGGKKPGRGRRVGFDVVILGEAISEFGMRRGNLVACRARVELKAVDASTGEILAVARHSGGAVDLTEALAGKTAIQKGTAKLMGSFVPKLVKSWREAHPGKARRLVEESKEDPAADGDEEF